MRTGSTFLMLLSALALGAAVVAEVRYGAIDALATALGGGEAPRGEGSVAAVPRLPQGPARALPDLVRLSATRDRPLFFEGREYPEPAPVETETSQAPTTPGPDQAAPTAPLGPVTLSAIVIVNDERVALLREGGAEESTYARVGEAINGWQVAEIRTDRVVLRNRGSTEELKLWKFEPVAPPPSGGTSAQRERGERPPADEDDVRARIRAERQRQLAEQRKAALEAARAQGTEVVPRSGRGRFPALVRPDRAAGDGEQRDCGLSRC